MKKLSLDASFKPTSREVTPEGFLRVKGIAARTGVYQYLASELDLDGPERIVNVYRPPEAVFDPESISTYVDKDVTIEHPDELVTSETFKEHSVGHVRGVEQDGENIIVDLIIKDQEAIDDINSGKSELSPGYLAEYVPIKGVAPTGEPYEFEQRDIVINHVAVVEAARAGKQARIFDHKPKGEPMAQRKVFLDAKKTRSVTLDEDAAAIVEQAIDALEDHAEELEAKADAAEAKADELEAKVEGLKAAAGDSAIAAKVAQVLKVTAAAKKIAPSFDSRGSVNTLEIMRGAMKSKRPTIDWDAKSEAYVQAAFDAAEEMEEEKEEKEEKTEKEYKDSLSGLAEDFRRASVRPVSDGRKAYEQFLKGGAQ